MILTLGWFYPPAYAAIRPLEEAPGQMVYQSRQTLHDQHGKSWQAIAFKRVNPDRQTTLYLRLVGFPGVADLDRSRPLTLTNSLGQSWMAADVSQPIFTDADRPEPNVGQYDLQPIILDLDPAVPLRLELPVLQQADVLIPMPSTLVAEWRLLATQSD
ncbi:MAG: DUF3122 domain-containing protein [Leptolyngbya sp. DLM2.Bin15]|nr:MAG: DUF3122 domain-containing protein [Leptolyngbya sp. DLM2.Bin15]